VSDADEQFERIFQDSYEAVVRYAARRVAPDAVQDVVSETFLIAWRRRPELGENPLPWLLGVARRVAANQRRGSIRRDALRERLRAEPQRTDSDALDPGLVGALETLGERDREALMLVAWDGFEHREAAKVMGCSTGAFTVRVYRARRRLARALVSAQTDPIQISEGVRSPL
jgi:RNA polymerase sigma-70 factor (ECF subfamily)